MFVFFLIVSDGKFILELARAREGEKTSWISVPRKTYWPPTVSSTSANFHKHESSTSLSFSDDNSSIQSSPWQRDHCWKQSNPRPNISKELSLYYFRPLKARIRPPSQDTRLRWRRKRRRPYESSLPPEATSKVPTNSSIEPEIVENGKSESRKKETNPPTDGNGEVVPESHSELSNGGTTTPMDTSEVTPASDDEERNGAQKPKGTNENGLMEDDRPQSNGHHLPPNGTHLRTSRRCKRPGGKDLISIIQTLLEQQQTKVSNCLASPAAVGPFRLGTIAERGNNGGSSFRSSVFTSSVAGQHVSPRKRILRELEKVSLDDVGSSGTSSTKRSRPKSGSAAGTPVIVTATTATPLSTLTTNGTGSPLNGGSATSHGSSSKANGHLNGSGSVANGTAGGTGKQSMNGAASSLSPASKTAPPAPAPVSKPFSSYSITSLLGHNSTSSSTSSGESSSAHAASFDAVQRKTDASVASVTSTASHHHYHHSQHPLSPHHHQYQGLTVGSKSPVMTDSTHHHAHYQGQLGSNRYGGGYSTKKRSPSYGGGNGTAASPGATSAGSGSVDPYGNTIRSPDLSPSPEHHHTHQQHSHHSAHHHTPGSVSNSGGFSRYRQHPYGGSPSSYSSAPSSSRFSPSPSTNDSATTPPYSGSGARSAIPYRTAYQLGGNGSQGHSPPASNGSPQHYSRASPLNFGRGAQHSSPPPQHQHSRNAATSSSPRASPNSGGGGITTSHATTPTSAMASLTTGVSPSGTIRTVPKKTAALRQPFAGGHSPSSSSPSRERSNSNASSSSIKKEPEGSDTVDGPALSHYGGGGAPSSPAGVIRPNTMIASPTAHHPVANPFYPLYPTQLAAASSASPSMNPSVVAAAAAAAANSVPFHPASLSYYQHMYNAATMAFRTPLWIHYPGLPAPHTPHMVQSPHHLPPSSTAPPSIPLADRQRMIDRLPPSPPPPPSATVASMTAEPTEAQRLQHSILATPGTTATAALNYSVTALSASSRDILNNGGSAFSSPSGSNWPTDAVGYQHHPDHSSRSSVSATAKDEPSNGECLQGLRSSYVPLNLSKH
uniref:Hairless n=1 Tax=Anopheles maculatus TaxID=74869 RepID=A0A182T8K3_9DIPT